MRRPVSGGVPQGSNSGPTPPFPLHQCLSNKLNSNAKLFADDIPFFTNVTDNNDSSNFLNNDLLFISKWVHNWEMVFNPDPSKPDQEVIFSTKKQVETHPIISQNNIQVETASYQKHLDLIQCQLSFSNISDMDKVKNAFAARMVSSSELHFTNSAKEPTSAEIQMNEACRLYSLMNTFQEKGWAIPKQVSFRYFCIF